MNATPSPFYLDWTFWNTVVALLAVLLSQLPPVSVLLRRTALDRRIADKARELRRHLVPSMTEDWGPPADGPAVDPLHRAIQKLDEAVRLTEPALGELVDLRAEASRRVRRAVGAARDHRNAAAELIRPLAPSPLVVDERHQARVKRIVDQAVAHMHDCCAALGSLTKDQG